MKEEIKKSAEAAKKRKAIDCSNERRIKHIAYCLLRGRTYEQIEQKVHECNVITKYQWKRIHEMVEKYSDENTLYVVVDGSLTKNQQFVQGAHAVAGHCLEFSQKPAIGTTEQSSCSKPKISPLSWIKSKLAG